MSPARSGNAGPACRCAHPATRLSSGPVNRSSDRRRRRLDRAPEFFVALFGDADLDAVRWRAMFAAMRQFARDHAIAHDIGVQIIPVGAVLHAAADVGPMPAAHIPKPIGGVPMVVELAANPDDRTGLGGERRFFTVALAILSRLEQVAFFGKERMLLDIRDAY